MLKGQKSLDVKYSSTIKLQKIKEFNLAKKFCSIFAVIIGIIFINGCYFVFHGQFKAVEKINSGKDLNTYEIFSTYTMHTACWAFGWIISPNAANILFKYQFNMLPNYISKNDYFKSDPILDKIKQNINEGESVYISYPDYKYPNALLLNGATVKCISKNFVNGNTIHLEYSIPFNYAPCTAKIKGFIIQEKLFDYLEKINILHPKIIIIDELSDTKNGE